MMIHIGIGCAGTEMAFQQLSEQQMDESQPFSAARSGINGEPAGWSGSCARNTQMSAKALRIT
jgi:hypothetical protein